MPAGCVSSHAEAMSAPTDLRIIPLGPEHRDEVLRLDQAAFAFSMNAVEPEQELESMEWDRTFAAVRPAAGPHRHADHASWGPDEELAGLMTSYSLALAVPGRGDSTRPLPVAGLSWVSVHPDHRRRGILTGLIRHHLHGLHDGGEAVSALFASEGSIYQRFGYGDAGPALSMSLPRGAELRDIPGTDQITTQLSPANQPGHVELVDSVFAVASSARPGRMTRPLTATRHLMRDHPERNRDAELNQLIVARRAGQPTGYALLRRTMDWRDGKPQGTVKVIELVGLDAATQHELWDRVLNMDLMTRVQTPPIGLDEPLLAWLVDVRSGGPARQDALWLRLVDVDRAMTARGYAHDVDAVFELADELCPWNAGRWRLRVTGEDATCERTDDEPGLSLATRELATAYLGGRSLASLAAAGLVTEHRAGALAELSTALRGLMEPAVPPMF